MRIIQRAIQLGTDFKMSPHTEPVKPDDFTIPVVLTDDEFLIPVVLDESENRDESENLEEYLHLYLNRAMIEELFCSEALMNDCDDIPEYLDNAIREIFKDPSKRIWYGIMTDGKTVVVKDGEKHCDQYFTHAQFITISHKNHDMCLVCDAEGVFKQELNTFATARLGHLIREHLLYGPIFITARP